MPVFVDQTSGSEASYSAFRIVICFKAPDVPQASSGGGRCGRRSPPKTGSLAPTGSREAQALVRLPTTISLKAKRTMVLFKGHRVAAVTLSGRLTELGTGIPAIRISLQEGKTRTS